MLAFPGFQVLDATGPLEVFGRAARWLVDRGRARALPYSVHLLAARRGPITNSSGFRLCADHAFREVRSLDTLLVSGGIGVPAAMHDEALLGWLRRMAPRVRRLGSICTGAFLLAEAGLLDGRRATTHWSSCAELARRYPRVRVDPDPVFVHDGVYTSAGVTAGMDLALQLVEEDFGREVTLEVARELVMFVRRPGGQAQFSATMKGQLAEREPLRELQAFIAENPGADLSVAALSRRAAMSPRNFWRSFSREVGVSPARFVESIRVEAARRRLEEAAACGLEELASACGFGSAEVMRRAFNRNLGVAPSDYRERFRRPQAPPSRTKLHAASSGLRALARRARASARAAGATRSAGPNRPSLRR